MLRTVQNEEEEAIRKEKPRSKTINSSANKENNANILVIAERGESSGLEPIHEQEQFNRGISESLKQIENENKQEKEYISTIKDALVQSK